MQEGEFAYNEFIIGFVVGLIVLTILMLVTAFIFGHHQAFGDMCSWNGITITIAGGAPR